MKIYIIYTAIVFGFLTSCKQGDEVLFKVDAKQDRTGVEFIPNMPFETISDSAYFYFSKEDYGKVVAAEILKGKQIYKSDKFEIRVIVRKYNPLSGTSFEFMLRTFSKDFKIIDSYIMASTTNNLICNGSINGDLEITTTCEDGTETIATIDEYGKFIVNE